MKTFKSIHFCLSFSSSVQIIKILKQTTTSIANYPSRNFYFCRFIFIYLNQRRTGSLGIREASGGPDKGEKKKETRGKKKEKKKGTKDKKRTLGDEKGS